MSNKIKKTSSSNDIITESNRRLSNPAKVGIIVALVIVLLVGAVLGAYAIIKENGRKSLLNSNVTQEYDSRYVSQINWNKHQQADIDEIYSLGGFADTDILANMATQKNFDIIYNHKKYSYNSNIINL